MMMMKGIPWTRTVRKEGMETYVVENKLDTQVPTQDKWPVNFNLLLSLRVGHKVRLSRLCL